MVMPATGSLRLERDPSDPSRTLILLNGQAVGSVPWEQCDEIALSFKRAARAGEQYAKANKVIDGDALLIRTGAPFALSRDTRMREEAFKEAQWGDARKKMPILGVPSRRAVGTPTFKKSRSES